MGTFVIGDIHGAHLALKQCLERANFDYDEDTLISLGDIVDGWPYVYECVEELIDIRYLIPIRGNHDEWFNDYIQWGIHHAKWSQGGLGTAKSYLRRIDKEHLIHPTKNGYVTALNPDDIPPLHQKFFNDQVRYYIDDKNRLFIHGGFNRHATLKGQSEYIYYWDRDLWGSALSFESMSRGDINKNSRFKIYDNFEEIFIGHTSTTNWGKDYPMHAANIYNLDTGAGWDGRLTIMNVDTKEYWQSDPVKELYPNETGR